MATNKENLERYLLMNALFKTGNGKLVEEIVEKVLAESEVKMEIKDEPK